MPCNAEVGRPLSSSHTLMGSLLSGLKLHCITKASSLHLLMLLSCGNMTRKVREKSARPLVIVAGACGCNQKQQDVMQTPDDVRRVLRPRAEAGCMW